MSLRGRLLAALLALVGLALAVAGVTTYIVLRTFLFNRVNATVQGLTTATQTALARGRIGSVSQLPILLPGSYVALQDPQGNAQGTRQHNVPVLPSSLPVSGRIFSAPSDDTPGTVYRVQVSELAGWTIVAAVPLTDFRDTLGHLVAVEVLVGSAILVAAAALGSWLVGLGLRPLVEIEGTAERIAEGDLTERVALDDDRTEVGRLGKVLNSMLARIEAAFEERRASEAALRASEERLRQFVSDASHELRTPVAAVRAYAELFRRGGDRHPEDLPRMMARVEAEAARMGVLVEDLLLLTRLDQGRPLEQAPVDLGALAADAVEAARTLDPDRPLVLDIEGSVEVLGDKDRLRQVADNLLANVRTHTPPGAPAKVTVRLAADRAILEVADSGPGIEPAALERIFERFYRADPSRARDRGGAGLGLSIVAAIAAAHGGTARAANRPGGGAAITIDLPALVDAPDPEPPGRLPSYPAPPETAASGDPQPEMSPAAGGGPP